MNTLMMHDSELDEILDELNSSSYGFCSVLVSDDRLAKLLEDKGIASKTSRGGYIKTNLFDYIWKIADYENGSYISIFRKWLFN